MSKNHEVYAITTPEGHTLIGEVLWGTSRGRDTYGYTTCSLRVEGKKVASCNGGGYDMRGTVFADWFEHYAPAQAALKALVPGSRYVCDAKGEILDRSYNEKHAYFRWLGSGDTAKRVVASEPDAGWYGLSHYVNEAGEVEDVSMYGSSGFESMKDILNACGYEVRRSG